MARCMLSDEEAEVSMVVFPKVYTGCASLLRGEDARATDDASDTIFVQVTGTVERSDRGLQIIAQEVVPLNRDVSYNSIHLLEVRLASSKLTQSTIRALKDTLDRYPGYDKVELLFETSDHECMHMEIPCQINAQSKLLRAEIKLLFGEDCTIAVFA